MAMLTVLLVAGAQSFTLPEAAARSLRQQFDQMSQAALRKDDGAVVKAMYPPVVRGMGGEAQVLRMLEDARHEIEAGGGVITSTLVAIRKCARQSAQIQCLLHGKQIIRVPEGRLESDTATLAFSDDGGVRWTFVDAGQDRRIRKALPEVSPDLPLRRQPPPRLQAEREPRMVRGGPFRRSRLKSRGPRGSRALRLHALHAG
jgi:hypothetical protein